MAQNAAPGVYFNTIDDSFYQADSTEKTLVSLHTIFSPRGPDNKIVTFGTNASESIKRYYGEPKFNKYGQSYHTAMQWADEGYETSICRLLPDDATYANIVFSYKKSKDLLFNIEKKAEYNDDLQVAIEEIEVPSLDKLRVGMKLWLTGWYKSDIITQVKTEATYTSTPIREIEVKSVDGLKEGMVIFIDGIDSPVTISKVVPGDGALTADKIRIKESTIISTVNANATIKEKVSNYAQYTISELIDEGVADSDQEWSKTGPFKIKFVEELKMTIEASTPVYLKENKVVVSSVKGANNSTILSDLFNEKIYTEVTPGFTSIKDEEVEIPFLVFYPYGRGVDYNKLSLQLFVDNSVEDTYTDFKVYCLRVYDRKTDNGTDVALSNEDFQFSFYPDAMDVNMTSLFIEDVLKIYSKYIQFFLSDYRLRLILCDMYGLDISEAQDYEIYSKDILQGNLAFNDINNNRFKNGSDGSLWTEDGSLNWGSDEDIESGALNNATNLLKSFYNGSLDQRLLDRKVIRAKYIWDNNYPIEVKRAMTTLVSTGRPDIRYIADTRMQVKEEGELNFRKNVFNVDHCNVTIYPNNGIVKDKYTGKKIQVTSTYNLAKIYAKVKNKLGPHYAIAGYNEKGRMDEMISLAYSPNQEYRNEFTKNQLNTIMSDPSGFYVMENITSQKQSSALQQNHIADTLQVIEVETADYCEKYLFNLRITDYNLTVVQGELSSFLSKWVANGACEWIDVKVEASDLQRSQQKVVANVSLKFASIAKQIELNFIVKGEGSSPAS